jgi:hypothetical protein
MRKLPSQTLFDQQRTGLHASYTKLRDGDEPYFSEQRDYLDGLWHRTRLHLDTDFKSRFALETDQRFWELRLAGTLLDLGYELDKAKKGRPDFGTHLPRTTSLDRGHSADPGGHSKRRSTGRFDAERRSPAGAS